LEKPERLRILNSLSESERTQLYYDWRFYARGNQLLPHGDSWTTWLIQAGRGFGKTRVGAEAVKFLAEWDPGCQIALIGRTAADVRDVMVLGESGIMRCSPPWFRPTYKPSKRRLIWPNGSVAFTYSGDEPDQLRGPQHHYGWGDEVASWRYTETFENLEFGLRLGYIPRLILTGTPKPTKTYKAVLSSGDVLMTRGSMMANERNLPESFKKKILNRFEGTRLGRQEIEGEYLEDNPNALWQRRWIDKTRIRQIPELVSVVVAIDPAASSGEDAAEHGIVVVGKGSDGHGYVLEDLSTVATPHEWATIAVNAAHRWQANCIVAERNNGGDMVGSTIRNVDKMIPVKLVWASKGKWTRAEPISALYEQFRIHHVGTFADLEDQMCEYEPLLLNQASPDRMDALVWGLTHLFISANGEVYGF